MLDMKLQILNDSISGRPKITVTYNKPDEKKAGWHMADIDRMDMVGFLRMRGWQANRVKQKAVPKRRFIDEVWRKTAR